MRGTIAQLRTVQAERLTRDERPHVAGGQRSRAHGTETRTRVPRPAAPSPESSSAGPYPRAFPPPGMAPLAVSGPLAQRRRFRESSRGWTAGAAERGSPREPARGVTPAGSTAFCEMRPPLIHAQRDAAIKTTAMRGGDRRHWAKPESCVFSVESCCGWMKVSNKATYFHIYF